MKWILAAVVLMAGCATKTVEPVTVRVPVEVKIPVPVPCLNLNDVPAIPKLANDVELAALSNRDLILSVEIQRRQLRAWRSQVDPLLAACSKG